MTDDLLPGAELPDDTSGLSDDELRALLDQARTSGDEPLRRLVRSYITLRRMSAEMVDLLATREGGQTIEQTPIFKRLRQLTKRERS